MRISDWSSDVCSSDLEERQYKQAARRLVSCSSMSCRLCACVSLIGCDCFAVCSAPSFLAIEHDIGTSFSDVITQDDTVVYGILCALASLDRQEDRKSTRLNSSH